MEKEFLVNQTQLTKEGYVIISSYFLDYCVEILGTGFHQILLKHGLIKKICKGKTASGNYRRNIYQVTPLRMVKNTLSEGNFFPYIEEKITPNLGKKLPTNNTNLNITNTTTANGEKDAVAAVDFKKLKEKGEEEMQAIRERMVELDFKEGFVEKILKEYSAKKIDAKLDLLMERKNIKRPAGWLRAALKNDYQEQERYDEEPGEQTSRQTPLSHLNFPPLMGKKPRETIVIDSHLSPEDRKILSRERVLKMIRKTREMLKNLKTKGGTNVRTKISN